WSAGTYTANQTAVKDGVLYRVKPSVSSTTGEPGVSEDWEPIGGGGGLAKWDSAKIYTWSSNREQYVIYQGDIWKLKESSTAAGTDVPGISDKWAKEVKGDNSPSSTIVGFHTLQHTGAYLNAGGQLTTAGGSTNVVSDFYPISDGDVFQFRNYVVPHPGGPLVTRSPLSFYADADEGTYLGGVSITGAANVTESELVSPPEVAKFYRVSWVVRPGSNPQFDLVIYNTSTSVSDIKKDVDINTNIAIVGESERGKLAIIRNSMGATYINFSGGFSASGPSGANVSDPIPVSENQVLRVFNSKGYVPSGQYTYLVAFYDEDDRMVGGVRSHGVDVIPDTGYVYPPKG